MATSLDPGSSLSLSTGAGPAARVLRLRWLGSRVAYRDAHALQRALWSAGPSADDWLLLLEHAHVFTAGIRSKAEHMLVDPASVGAELLWVDRGGDITYHGPGQLVGYPVITVPSGPGATPGYVHELEEVVILALERLGLPGAGRLAGFPGVWVGQEGPSPRKICAIGARHSRRRTMHGFALNVSPDLTMFQRIVPCGIEGKAVTSLAAEGVQASMREAVEAVFAVVCERWAGGGRRVERQDVAWSVTAPTADQAGEPGQGGATGGPPPGEPAGQGGRAEPGELGELAVAGQLSAEPARGGPVPVRLVRRMAAAGVDAAATLPAGSRKPSWLRANARMGAEYRSLHKTVHGLGLVTVCEEAGCPNIFECWADGTATFMINGDHCTRSCGFCQVGSGKPLPLDPGEPLRVAEAIARLGLAHAVVTCVARDDLPDGGAKGFAATIEAVRRRCPGTAVEVLISDCKGDPSSLAEIFDRRPDVLNHNVETVPRLQRLVRPSASYTRSLAVLARAVDAGLTAKSGLMVGLGESEDEVLGVLSDLRSIGVSIVTIGQYLRPTEAHLPVARWWPPEDFVRLGEAARALGIPEVVASPLTRSSYHARQAAEGVAKADGGTGVGTGGPASEASPATARGGAA